MTSRTGLLVVGVVVVVVGLGACGSAPVREPLQGRGTRPATSSAPAPAIGWSETGFAPTGLPAVASDGTVVVTARRDEDGGRGNPNLTIIVTDRRDAVIKRVSVMTAEDAETMYDDRGAGAELKRRIAAANAMLADLHRAHDLVPLVQLAIDDSGPPEDHTRATGKNLIVDWKPSHLTIRRDGVRVVDTETSAAWLARDHAMCATCGEVCHNPAYLAAVWADAARNIALISISYTGTDTCWEPSSQHHVVGW
jgi:hypothetical protein